MGLCKCPKRKVTNLFCFEHRVNVCEYCLIENHPKCVVQSYLNWLKDSDYDSSCALCNISLVEGDVARLMCYDVFHTDCLQKHYQALPSNTAPAGYKCYTCDSPVFPATNQAGFVVDKLKEVLAKHSWARLGLGLPLIDEPPVKTSIDDSFDATPLIDDLDNESLHGSSVPVTSSSADASVLSTPDLSFSQPSRTLRESFVTDNFREQTKVPPLHSQHRDPVATAKPKADFAISVNDNSSGDAFDVGAVSRKAFGGSHSTAFRGITLGGDDPDGPEKYRRRSAFSWLRRWLKSRMLRGRGYHDSRVLPRRAAILLLIGLIAFLTFIMFATKVGRRPGDNDPNFDPLNNPNIHVARRVAVDKFIEANLDLQDPLQELQPAAGGG